MKRRMLGFVLAAVAITGTSQASSAGQACVNYRVTGPVIGTTQNNFCQGLPSQFDSPVSWWNCRGIPPAGVTICVGASVHLIMP